LEPTGSLRPTDEFTLSSLSDSWVAPGIATVPKSGVVGHDKRSL
jgi:hypothetical protein